MSHVQVFNVEEPYLRSACSLGEGPHFQPGTDTLRFVDIVQQKLHLIDVNEGPSSLKTLKFDSAICHTADIEGDDSRCMYGGKSGFGVVDLQSGERKELRGYWEGEGEGQRKENERRFRGNDGAVDASGRYWGGIMGDPLVNEPTNNAIVFRLDPDLTLHKMIEGFTIPNGACWSLDSKTMYIADSPTKNLYAYDYDLSTGSISNRRVHFHVDDEAGVPDGHAIDAEGCIWQAIFGCGKVVRISPEGKILAEVRLPTRCVTCPTFAGEDLFITTHEEVDPEKYPESVAMQGDLFRVNVGVKGLPKYKFRLEK